MVFSYNSILLAYLALQAWCLNSSHFTGDSLSGIPHLPCLNASGSGDHLGDSGIFLTLDKPCNFWSGTGGVTLGNSNGSKLVEGFCSSSNSGVCLIFNMAVCSKPFRSSGVLVSSPIDFEFLSLAFLLRKTKQNKNLSYRFPSCNLLFLCWTLGVVAWLLISFVTLDMFLHWASFPIYNIK